MFDYFVLRMCNQTAGVMIVQRYVTLEYGIAYCEDYNRTGGVGGRYFVATEKELSSYEGLL